ncbi:hypothetical protein NTR1_86 [Nocardia phage NTR1]|nr:hypothetical protein NTR1_86 [Nocardia phage NTR1]
MGIAYERPIHPDQAESARGEQRFFRMVPPLPAAWGEEGEHTYVIASAAVVPFSGPETYLFPATPDGMIESYGELDGSQRGTLDIDYVVANAGEGYDLRDDSDVIDAEIVDVDQKAVEA